MGYRLSRRADLDLDMLLVTGIERFGVDQANRYFDDLIRLFELIATQPRMARVRKDIGPAVRLYPHRAHLVFYREEGAGVLILRILHGRQDWMQHFTA